jgi:membrane carboxypeptidase/penicillin-binding protein
MLAGLPQAPSAYDSLQHYSVAKQRQRHVLDQLVANHDLTRAQANSAFRRSLPLRELAPKSRSGQSHSMGGSRNRAPGGISDASPAA